MGVSGQHVKRKSVVEESEDDSEEHMSCRDLPDEDASMQELLEQEKEEEIMNKV
jgi:hypothetical protein